MNRSCIGSTIVAALVAVVGATTNGQEPIGTAFTYQGQLRQGGFPLTGTADFQFSLWDAAATPPGVQIGALLSLDNAAVSNGLFTATLDFGAGVSPGAARWLEVAVRSPSGSGSFTTLSPRQELTPAPNALYAERAPWEGISGIPGGGFWQLNGNSGSDPAFNHLGTNDSQPLCLKANGVRGLTLSPCWVFGYGHVNVIAGHDANEVQDGAGAATISGGGGLTENANRIFDTGGAIGGGTGNTAGSQDGDSWAQRYPTVAGGSGNRASGPFSSVGGGYANTASGSAATVPGGHVNTAAGTCSFAAGGWASANHDFSFVWNDDWSSNFASTAPRQFLIHAAGGVGLNTSTPGFPLTFADAEGDKISLFGQSGNHYGFGIASYLLQIHTNTSSADIAFGHGRSASFTETMRVKGTGNVGIGTTVPNARLHVNGDGTSPSLRIQVDGNSKLTAANNGGVSIGGYLDSPPENGLYVAADTSIGTSSPAADTRLTVSGTTTAIQARATTSYGGSGLSAVGNGLGTWLENDGGAGIEANGLYTGVFGNAMRDGDYGQSGGYFRTGTDDVYPEAYAWVARKSVSGTVYKILGTGTVSTVMTTGRGRVALFAPESPSPWFEDLGDGEIHNGRAHVDLDPTFLECVTIDDQHPLKVFVQLTSLLADPFYVKKGSTGFDVIVVGNEEAAATFDYRVVASWKGLEHVRFEAVDPPPTVRIRTPAGESVAEQPGIERDRAIERQQTSEEER